MNAKKLSVAQMAWLAHHEVSYAVNAKGCEVFTKGNLELCETGSGWMLFNTMAKVWDEDMLTTDGSHWECRSLLATLPDRKQALAVLVAK